VNNFARAWLRGLKNDAKRDRGWTKGVACRAAARRRRDGVNANYHSDANVTL